MGTIGNEKANSFWANKLTDAEKINESTPMR